MVALVCGVCRRTLGASRNYAGFKEAFIINRLDEEPQKHPRLS
jgi:hypothetical protein